MIHYNRSWNSFGDVLIIVGVCAIVMLLLSIKQYLIDGNYVSILILLLIGILFIASGVLVKKWAKKNGKNNE